MSAAWRKKALWYYSYLESEENLTDDDFWRVFFSEALSDDLRVALVLRLGMDGKGNRTHAEIAEYMGCGHGAARSRSVRAIHHLTRNMRMIQANREPIRGDDALRAFTKVPRWFLKSANAKGIFS